MRLSKKHKKKSKFNKWNSNAKENNVASKIIG